jgi:hypothetical protein
MEASLTISQRAEMFVKMKEKLPPEASSRLMELFIKHLNNVNTDSIERKALFCIIKNSLPPANLLAAAESFYLDINNPEIDIQDRVKVFEFMRLYIPKRSSVSMLEILVKEITSDNFSIEKRCDVYQSLKELLNNDMHSAIANSFLVEVQKPSCNSVDCRTLFVLSKSYLTHELLLEFVKVFMKHIANHEVNPRERRDIFHLIKNYISVDLPLPLEGFIYDIQMEGAVHHDRRESFIIIKEHLGKDKCREMMAYFNIDFSSNELPPQKRVLLFSLIKTYLFGESLEIAVDALLRDLEAYVMTVEERLELFSILKKYLNPVKQNRAIRSFIRDVTSPVSKLTRCIDPFKLLQTHLTKNEMKELVKPMLEKMHIRLLSTEDRKEGFLAIGEYLDKKQVVSVYSALMIGVLDIKADLKVRVRLYMELRKYLNSSQKEIAITSLLKAHNNLEIPRKQRIQFLRIFGEEIPKKLLSEASALLGLT